VEVVYVYAGLEKGLEWWNGLDCGKNKHYHSITVKLIAY